MNKVMASAIAMVLILSACSKSEPAADKSPASEPKTESATPSAEASAASPSPSMSASPSPENLPISEARLAGRFLGGGLGFDLTFVPKCKTGPCDVWGVSGKSKTKFAQDGSFYRGGGTYHEDCTAGGITADMAVKLRMTMRVTKAEYVKGVWTASALDFQARFDSPGAHKSVTSGGWIHTVTCDPVHKKMHGKMFLKGH